MKYTHEELILMDGIVKSVAGGISSDSNYWESDGASVSEAVEFAISFADEYITRISKL
jgi:hypothetical protein